MNKEYNYIYIPIPNSLFDWIESIPYLIRIRNKEWNNVFVPFFLFY